MNNTTASTPASRLLSRLHEFAQDLDDEERQLFAALVGPGMKELTNDDEVSGFTADAPRWEPGSLRDQLAQAAEAGGWQIVSNRAE